MTDAELDALLRGAKSTMLTLSTRDGPVWFYLTRHDLATPVAWRAAMRRALGHTGYRAPVYSQEDHDALVRALVRLADAEVLVAGARVGR